MADNGEIKLRRIVIISMVVDPNGRFMYKEASIFFPFLINKKIVVSSLDLLIQKEPQLLLHPLAN